MSIREITTAVADDAAEPAGPAGPAAPETDRPPARLPSLTGLRWLAAFMVFGFHIGTLHVISKPYYQSKWNTVFGQGAAGVSFFFILSGFVLTWTARSGGQTGDSAVRFWRRRIAKIFPNHAVTWLIVILVMLAWGDELRKEVALGNLFLLQTWFNFDTFPYSINTVSWSLSCEAFFYLCFPFVLPWLRRAHDYVLHTLAAVLAAVIFEVQNWTANLPFDQRWWLTQLFPPVRSLEFWLGAVAALLVIRKRWYGPGLWVATGITVAVTVANQTWDAKFWTVDSAIAFTFLIAAAAEADIAGRWTPWRNRPLVWLGEVSFAFYLVHVAFMSNMIRYLQVHGVDLHGHVQYYLLPGYFLASLLLAWLLFQFVETPMNRRLRPRSSGTGRVDQPDLPRRSHRLAFSTGVGGGVRQLRGLSPRRPSEEAQKDQAVGT
jgi:peptidoglycan/LPS O-acetylase OafA/YrhL